MDIGKEKYTKNLPFHRNFRALSYVDRFLLSTKTESFPHF